MQFLSGLPYRILHLKLVEPRKETNMETVLYVIPETPRKQVKLSEGAGSNTALPQYDYRRCPIIQALANRSVDS